MADGLIQTLARLLEEGSVPWSSVSVKQRDQLRSLCEAGVLTTERSGGGRRLAVQNEEVVRRFAEDKYPAGLDGARAAADRGAEEPLQASEAVAHFRDAKRGAAGDEVLLFRGLPGTTIIYEGAPLRIGRLTKVAGVAAVLLGPGTEIAVEEPLAIVENREAFLRFDELGTAARLACFGRGRLSNQALEWLGSLDVGRDAICHCPDYDPVGLSEFQRLHDACGERVRLFWPDGLEALLEQYGKADLYESNTTLLNGMDDSSHPTIKKLMVLLQQHGRGLEQEILLSKNAGEEGGSSL
ncbi:hypothetical protein [Salinibacter altiplanensis]|uniref:hypothetical protein n=1 Tax=Salinibacter altiplanensis TaxID=1803181 RepID=UPI000C9F9430|nr:hypothetical protein [Salinibacter altiplanensis]